MTKGSPFSFLTLVKYTVPEPAEMVSEGCMKVDGTEPFEPLILKLRSMLPLIWLT